MFLIFSDSMVESFDEFFQDAIKQWHLDDMKVTNVLAMTDGISVHVSIDATWLGMSIAKILTLPFVNAGLDVIYTAVSIQNNEDGKPRLLFIARYGDVETTEQFVREFIE